MRTVYAHTPPGLAPPYVNVSQVEVGKYEITVRGEPAAPFGPVARTGLAAAFGPVACMGLAADRVLEMGLALLAAGDPPSGGTLSALGSVLRERVRQKHEGHHEGADDRWRGDELVNAAVAFAAGATGENVRNWWPFQGRYPALNENDPGRTRRAMCVRAAALLVAEIERIDREAPLVQAD
jgi:hypothetical protein